MTTANLIVADWLVALGLLASLNLIVGKTGVWSIGHVAFYASGQLLLGVSVVFIDVPVVPSIGLAVLGSGLLALALGERTLRRASVQVWIDDLDDEATSRRSWFGFYYCHD